MEIKEILIYETTWINLKNIEGRHAQNIMCDKNIYISKSEI